MVISINSDNFESEILNSDKPVLIDFYADWCGPCKLSIPAVEEVAQELSAKIKVAKINVDNSPELAIKFGVMSIPTFIVVKDGKEFKKTVGAQTVDSLKALLSEVL